LDELGPERDRLPRPLTRVLVTADADKEAATRLFGRIVPWLEQRGIAVEAHPDLWRFAAEREQAQGRAGQAPAPQLAVVLGGDGAMLTAVRAFRSHPVPMFGINFGRVGFLAATPQGHWEESLSAVIAGEGTIEPRMRLLMVHHSVRGDRRSIALNDVVVSRAPEDGMLQIALSSGPEWVTNYRADGLILATPSGSTAYSLSAGGPILAPSMLGVVVTPICSQALSNRPLVLHPDSELHVRLPRAGARADVVVDGRRFSALAHGDELVLTRHPLPYPLLSMPGLDPWRRLRERLGWGGDIERS
jgi:NAD+ kinase